MLVATVEGRRVEAWLAERGQAFTCPNCDAPVILKRGRIKVAHFAHKPPTICSWAGGETQAHLRAKRQLLDGFIARGLQAEVEVPVLSIEGDRRSDVLVWKPGATSRVAIEVQHQPISFDAINARTKAYMAAKTPVIWVSLISQAMWDNAVPIEGGWEIERYSVRPWERWAHTYSKGALWFIDPATGLLWRGTLSKYMIEVPATSWYDGYGNEESAGGYMRTSRKWRRLTLHGPFQPATVLIKLFRRDAWSNENYSVPAGRAARFMPPDEAGASD